MTSKCSTVLPFVSWASGSAPLANINLKHSSCPKHAANANGYSPQYTYLQKKTFHKTTSSITNRFIPIIVGFRTNIDPFVVKGICSRHFLVFWAHEITKTSLLKVDVVVKKKFYHGRVFVDYSDV